MAAVKQPLLSIMVPTVEGREESFNKLKEEIFTQGQGIGAFQDGELEFIMMKDKKEITIGKKRQLLYAAANGKFGVQVDDDDFIRYDAIISIMNAIKEHPDVDCITYKELCIFDGQRVQSCNHSLKYKSWQDNHDGFNYVRTPFFKDVIRMDIARIPGLIPDIRYSEDHEFAKNIYPLLKTEHWINEFVYIYQHNSSEFKERYGIK